MDNQRTIALWALLSVSLYYPIEGTALAQAPQPPTAQQKVQTVNVRINGEALPFTGQGAIYRNNAVLVPLRGIFEKLGADVKFDPATGSINAVKLDRTIALRVGDTVGFINGTPRTLSTPAVVFNGAILVPLRFVSDALGAVIDWDSNTLVADITTDAITAQKLPTPPADTPVVGGVLTGVYPEIGAVTVRISTSENIRVLFNKDVEVQIREIGEPKERVNLNSLRLGDQVQIRRDRLGYASVIQVLRDLRRGVIKSKTLKENGNTEILFGTGATIELVKDAPILMGTSVLGINDVKENEILVVRLNLETGLGISAAVASENEPNPTPPEADFKPEPEAPPEGVVIEPKPLENPVTPNPNIKPEVKEISHNGAGRMLKAGDTLTITVKGVPGGKVQASVTGLVNARDVILTEKADEAGTYTGEVIIPVGVTLKEAMVTATMTIGETITPVAQATDPLAIDSAGPEIMGIGPEDGGTLTNPRPRIYGAYSDSGSKADPKTLKVLLNGKDITDKVDVTEAFFSYIPEEDMTAGKVTMTVSIQDIAGNESRREWSFTVAPPEKTVRNMSITPTDRALRSDETLTVRLDGIAGGIATFKLGPLSDLPMQEESPGVYIGKYTVKKGDSVTKAPVTITFTPPGKEKVTLNPPGTITLAAGPPAPPIIDYPYEGVVTRGNYVILKGRATPDVKVRIKVTYGGRPLLGNTVNGEVGVVEVETDTQGNWKSSPILLEVKGGFKDIEFTAEVIAVREGNEFSAPSTVRFKR